MHIKLLTDINQKTVEAFTKLITQLDDHAVPPTKEDLEKLTTSETSFLFVAVENGEILGTLTIGTYIIPTGTKVWIEDVVVDNTARGKGIGKQLLQHAIEFSKKRGWKKIDLTSRPTRIAANKLYRKLGFELRETNMYRISLH